LTLIVSAQNQGEGAYEAELFVIVPPQADFIGVVRNNEVKFQLSPLSSLISGAAMEVCGKRVHQWCFLCFSLKAKHQKNKKFLLSPKAV